MPFTIPVPEEPSTFLPDSYAHYFFFFTSHPYAAYSSFYLGIFTHRIPPYCGSMWKQQLCYSGTVQISQSQPEVLTVKIQACFWGWFI